MQHTARSGLLSHLYKLRDDLERMSDFHRHRLWATQHAFSQLLLAEQGVEHTLPAHQVLEISLHPANSLHECLLKATNCFC
jgi:hypothetical protein